MSKGLIMTTPSTKTEDVERLCARDLTEIAMSKGMAISAEDIAAVTLAAATLRAIVAERNTLRKVLTDTLHAHESGWIAGEDWGAAQRAHDALEATQ